MAKFQKGQSGNPGGRPKVLAELQELARAQTPENIKRLIHLRDHAQSEQVQLGAIRELNDRGWGRPPQALLHTAQSAEDSAFKEFLRSIDGESRRLPRGNDPDADREYDAAQAQRAQGGYSAA